MTPSASVEHPSRRRFLKSLLQGMGAGCALLFGGRAATGRADAGSPLERRIAAFLPDAGSARAVGRAYLREHPGTRRDELLGSLGAIGLLDGPAHPSRLAECARADFHAGRVRPVDGWILARSEAELCALSALVVRGGGMGAGRSLHG